ncbi:hypothetical protein N9R69_01070 [Flavobacteriaceae bacterium]|nr:hypothetical protein [Flavobacteriaceae bacterium]MDC0612784.1 hypothetical protein [bacterium]MDG1052353.1 hypothetical protein [Flavobacteriaceae bacterium]
MKINLFKLEKNKRFNYNPRYYKDKSIKNIYEFDSVYKKNRNYNNTSDLSSQWKDARIFHRNRSNRSFSNRIVIIFLLLVLIFLFIIDFDLSIFYS